MIFVLALNGVCIGRKKINALMEWWLEERIRCGMEGNRPISCQGMVGVEVKGFGKERTEICT